MRQNDTSRNSQVRLNFSIDEELEAQLAAYEEATGRKQTAVIRQLLIEWLEGARELPENHPEHPAGRRTNINISARVRDALERKVTADKLPSLSSVVSSLLRSFLANRVPQPEDHVTLRLRLPAQVAQQFTNICALRGEDPARAIEIMIEARVRESLEALKESK